MDERITNRCKSFHKEKVLIILSVVFILCLITIPTQKAFAYNHLSAVLLMNADTGEVLYEQNGTAQMEIASTTKILTAITVIENADLFQVAEIPQKAVGVEGSSIYLRKGEKWQILDLVYGLMLRSGNDAAVALAILTSSSESAFCDLMNTIALKAGATNSRFVNPHGLHHPDHYSTALDLARITRYALNCPIFQKICSTKTHKAVKETANGREKVIFYNKNKLLYAYPNATGVKTGYTTKSGRCLVSAAERDGLRLICVTLNVYDTYGVSKNLFERYFQEL